MLAVGWMGGGGALWREMWAARTAQTGEQIGKKELLTTLLTDCLRANRSKWKLFNYFRLVGEVGLEPTKSSDG